MSKFISVIIIGLMLGVSSSVSYADPNSEFGPAFNSGFRA